MTRPVDGDRDPTSGDAPTSSAAVRPKLPPPPEVGPKDGEAPRERTAVTRHPRPNGPSDPKELLPTIRMPPIEARAVRRDADNLASRLGIGGAGKRHAEPKPTDDAPATDVPAEPSTASVESVDAPPPAVAAADAPASAPSDQRELAPTLQLQAVPVMPETRERPVHPQARRPPLPLPSVLRAGPRTLGGARMPPPAEVGPSERSAPWPGLPEPMPMIDTATLVADCTEQLLELEAAATAAAEISAAEATPPDEGSEPSIDPAVAIVSAARATSSPEVLVVPPDELDAEPARKWGWIVAAAAVLVAVIGLASYGGSSDAQEQKPAAPNESALSSVAESGSERTRAAAVPAPAPKASPALAMAPVAPPPPEPALVAPEPALPTEGIDGAAPPPAPTLVEPEPAVEVPVAIDDDAPAIEAAPAPSKHAKSGKHAKSSKHAKASSKTKPASPSAKPKSAPAAAPKAAAAAPAAAAGTPDAAALLREAEAAYAKGSWGTALRTAQRSQSMKSNGRALKIIAMAACRLGKQDTAQRAFDRVPLGMRSSVRTTCRDVGVKLRI